MSSTLPLSELPALKRSAHVWVGYSGGLDSTVLLHRLLHSPLKKRLRAVHVHHGLQALADEWAQRGATQCRDWAVPFELLKVRIDPRDSAGPEAAARAARYAALAALMQPGDVLVTAHHQDDQAETVLLNLLRGAGVEGIAAMRGLEDFGTLGLLWRPLLQLPRAALHDYAQQHGLQWIEDPHNTDPRYARSFLRADILPRLKARWPQAVELLARAASNCADTADLIEQWTALDLQNVADGETLSVSALLRLDQQRMQNLLRQHLRCLTGYAPSRDQLLRIERELLRAKPDAVPLLRIGNHELRRYRDQLCFFAAPLPVAPGTFQLPWDGRGSIQLPTGCGELQAPQRAKTVQLTIRAARGSERLKLAAGRPSRTLKNLFQEAGVPPWVRQRMPLIYADDELVCAGCHWWSAGVAPGLRRIVWSHTLPGWNKKREEQE